MLEFRYICACCQAAVLCIYVGFFAGAKKAYILLRFIAKDRLEEHHAGDFAYSRGRLPQCITDCTVCVKYLIIVTMGEVSKFEVSEFSEGRGAILWECSNPRWGC